MSNLPDAAVFRRPNRAWHTRLASGFAAAWLATRGAAALATLAFACALAHAGPAPGVSIVNVAAGTASDATSTPIAVQSNPVTAIVGASTPPALAFFRDATYARTIRVTGVSDPLYLEASAPGCDLDPFAPDTILVTLRSSLSGDVETFRAIETAAASGHFRVGPEIPTQVAIAASTVGTPGTLEIATNDLITATLVGCGAARTVASVYVDPAGTVFDSRAGNPIGGARVTLIDVLGTGNGGDVGGAARVYQSDGVTPAPSSLVTGADGRYLFPSVGAGTFRLVVVPPADHRFPSSVPVAALPAGHAIDAAGSYGGDFSVASAGDPVRVDVPLDANPTRALFVEKRASRAFAEPGDELDYLVRVANRSDSSIAAVTLEDRLPIGFAYVPGSARRDTTRLAEPAGARGPQLVLDLGALASNVVVEVRYRVRLNASARDGDGVNRAVAYGGGIRSNEASARVVLTGGVFADEASVIGTVYADGNRDRAHGAGEPGIPGVRLYLDDGTFVVTDADGQYSMVGLPPRSMSLKLDATTLPRGATPLAPTRARGDRPGLRFLDLERGDLQRADFAIAMDSTARRVVDTRRMIAAAPGAELRNGLQRVLTTTDAAPGDSRALPATGIVGEATRLPLFDAARADAVPTAGAAPTPETPAGAAARAIARLTAPATDAADEGSLANRAVAANAASAAGMTLAAVVSNTDAPGAPPPGARAANPLMWLLSECGSSGDSLPGMLSAAQLDSALEHGREAAAFARHDTLLTDQTGVRISGPEGTSLELSVNGVPVPVTRVGRRSTLPQRGIVVWDYVGVQLQPGLNELTATARDVDGFARGWHTLRVVAPSRLARLALIAPAGTPADGHSVARIRLRTLDARGVPVPARTQVTLESTLGQWQEADADPVAPGLQVLVEGGERIVALLAPAVPGQATLSARAGSAHAEAPIAFVPELRPLIVVGAAEGVVRLEDLTRGPEAGRVPMGGFSQEMREFSSTSLDGGASAAARASLFAKGRVRDDLLLTLGYDSDRPDGLRRLRDIQPDAYYPLYGDASVRGFDAQSTGRLYARLDRRGASLLYGDFVTPGAGGASSLGSYSRSLSGVQQHFEDSRVRVDAFTSRERTKSHVDEIAARGVSGPYLLTASPVVENSEQVELVVRDRNQPSIILSTSPRARFSDYELEPLTGRLLFKAPVASRDPDLNPVYIRVSYELEGGGEPAWVSGVQARTKLGDRLELGGAYVDDHDPAQPYQLRSAFAATRLGAGTALEAEFATSRRADGATGDGGRLDLHHDGAKAQARLYGAVTDDAFSNPTAGFSSGREEAGGHLSLRVGERTRVLADALLSADAAGDDRRTGALVGVDQGLTPSLRGEFGLRVADERRRAGLTTPTQLSLRGKLAAQWPGHPEWSGYGEAEQDVRESGRRMLALGGEYHVTTRGRLYARHELLSSLTGPYALDATQRRLSTVFGVDADVASDAHLFSEYRVADAIGARDAEAAFGLRNGWKLADGLRASTSLERVTPFGDASASPSLAVTASVENVGDDDVKASTRLEVRSAATGASVLATAGVACRLDSAWTALGRNLMSVASGATTGGAQVDRLQIGLAYRRADRAAWDALVRYELHFERGAIEADPGRQRVANVLSTNVGGIALGGTTASLAWAGKIAVEQGADLHTTTRAQWLHGRWSRRFGDAWDGGLNTSVLFVNGFRSRKDGLGVEVGRGIGSAIRLSAGWNRFGYSDADLPDEAYTRAGVFFRLRARFDETDLVRPGVKR